MTTEIIKSELETAPLALINEATSLKVVDQITFGIAGELGKTLKEEIKKREEYFEPMRIKAKASYDEVLKMKKDAISPLEVQVDALRKTMNVYLQEQERIRREEEARLQREENERARKEQERLLAQAAKAEEKGQYEKAEEKLEQAEMVYAAPVTVAPKVETAKFDGGAVGQVKEIQITVTDVKAFLMALLQKGMAPTMIEIKVAPLKAWQKANAITTFPGLHIVETVSARIR
jgi:hypothetical protein